ncbi:glycosyltransferase family 9 protein [Thermodesulforhabdus norvegica]|uniref:ADP-heptose:LPS heptosyltransferase n=1 Tax=Thermodesulforhabdus norvegica TaxID=39841 RepID=A0A1I4U8G2_9BACT|nr:glycosyltransferase family 9 protein [Thermodesulforhabdus norvegica]SFM85262.1 ADP-heptose:LPS heptosyltransferase [Thermodesulforhabdus norvegica]
MDKITVFHRGALGDFLLACPVIKGLSEFMKVQVYFMARRDYVALVRNAPFFAGFIPHDSSSIAPFFDDFLWKKAKVPNVLTESKAAFFFGQKFLRNVVDRLNKRLGNDVCYWVQSFPDLNSCVKKHVTFFLRDQLKELGFPLELQYFNPLDHEKGLLSASCSKDRPVVIHPGSGGLRKIWPLKNWRATVLYIKQKYPAIPVLIVIGPADDVARPLAKSLEELPGVSVVDGPELMELARILATSRIYLGNDSGVSHLAAAVGAACCVIFGRTDPSVWAPLGKDVTIVKDCWDEIDVTAEDFRMPPDKALHPEIRAFIDRRLADCDLPRTGKSFH